MWTFVKLHCQYINIREGIGGGADYNSCRKM